MEEMLNALKEELTGNENPYLRSYAASLVNNYFKSLNKAHQRAMDELRRKPCNLERLIEYSCLWLDEEFRLLYKSYVSRHMSASDSIVTVEQVTKAYNELKPQLIALLELASADNACEVLLEAASSAEHLSDTAILRLAQSNDKYVQICLFHNQVLRQDVGIERFLDGVNWKTDKLHPCYAPLFCKHLSDIIKARINNSCQNDNVSEYELRARFDEREKADGKNISQWHQDNWAIGKIFLFAYFDENYLTRDMNLSKELIEQMRTAGVANEALDSTASEASRMNFKVREVARNEAKTFGYTEELADKAFELLLEISNVI